MPNNFHAIFGKLEKILPLSESNQFGRDGNDMNSSMYIRIFIIHLYYPETVPKVIEYSISNIFNIFDTL